jgi:DNA-binding CsgD family transcriptional regulator
MARQLFLAREFEILCLIGSGKTAGEIANLLSLSGKTIGAYRARILEKMNMKTNADRMRYSIPTGLSW